MEVNMFSNITSNQNLYKSRLFLNDYLCFNSKDLTFSSFLVIGGAGTIGSATVKELFKLNPKVLHVVDINENALAELVRDIRSSFGHIEGEFKTFAIDAGSDIFDAFIKNAPEYDYVLNFSALKHVRSEKDPFTLMRMVEVNILNTKKTIEWAVRKKAKKYFCVSTDKATKPVNLMGASKRIMELFLMKYSSQINVSTARFANVYMSNGSLPEAFIYRIQKRQPIAGPSDVRRYFITQEESGRLCLLSTLIGENMEIFVPKVEKLEVLSFKDIAIKILKSIGYEPYFCDSEEEARSMAKELISKGKWPCYFAPSDTTGEKEIEEFYTQEDDVDFSKFEDIAVIKGKINFDSSKLEEFEKGIEKLRKAGNWKKKDIVELFYYVLGEELNYTDLGRYLDDKM